MPSSPAKTVGQRIYLHVEITFLEPSLEYRLREAERLAGVHRGRHFNLIRLDQDGSRIALLHYPNFFDDPFPTLRESWLLDTETGQVSYRTYAQSPNPPILHRKELLLPEDHPRRAQYAALTEAAEAIGLFDQPTRIGYLRQWLVLVREKGYCIDGHSLVPLGNDISNTVSQEPAALHADWQAARQLTALVRYGFSAPIQSLARYGFLDGRFTIFDYGCGRGNDVRGLTENGLSAAGWDPYYAPYSTIQEADIVNLGFVINVIEDLDERLEALARAWFLADKLLVVAVMLANQNDVRGQRFRDGVLTQRGTFQKYYTQAEIKTFVGQALREEPIPVAPGVLYVFRDKDAEQRFLVDRYRSRRNLLRSPSYRERPVRDRLVRERRDRTAEKYAQYQQPLDNLWQLWLTLGRAPDKAEVQNRVTLTEGFGSLSKALRFIKSRHDEAEETIEAACAARIKDLTVYFALTQLERRKPYRHLEVGLQRDIRAFFGDYKEALAAARDLLFRIADVAAIEAACMEAAENGLGWLEPGQSLQLHVNLVEQLPPLLRVYVGCAALLYGDYRHADLIKLHIQSGKVSLLRYDDFEGQPLPRMVERVKIKLREQDIDYFAYGEEYPAPYLYDKSRYIDEEFPHYPEQLAFEEALQRLELDLSGYGPPPERFETLLASRRRNVEGFELVPSRNIPDLDTPCGQFLTFRQLIECGETQSETGLANLPRQLESYNSLFELADRVLDPVIDYFGMIRLTYGFCSPELARKIPGRIDPKRDQHAAHELNQRGKLVCERLGAAVDFIVDDEDMLEVAQWLVDNTPFDRLYFYGSDLPVHVSYGPDHSRQIVRMRLTTRGTLCPRVMNREDFLALARIAHG